MLAGCKPLFYFFKSLKQKESFYKLRLHKENIIYYTLSTVRSELFKLANVPADARKKPRADYIF